MAGELVLVLLVILILVGPGRLAEMPGLLVGKRPGGSRSAAKRARREGHSDGGRPAPSPGAGAARVDGPRAERRSSLKLVWKWSNVAGWAMIVGGLGLIVGDLFWWHIGPPVQGPAVLLLLVGPWLIF
ncbi:MAG: hypothetical protein HY331_07630 [Chloroflexi bacterium]|nr:hypothetical protein [Chloroflexota bacterium]